MPSFVHQNTGPDQNFGNLRGFGHLHEDMVFGEVMANVMADHRIYSSGIFFDDYMWENEDLTRRDLFGPWAFRKDRQYVSIFDRAGNKTRWGSIIIFFFKIGCCCTQPPLSFLIICDTCDIIVAMNIIIIIIVLA
jgi:hypothetical protein